MRHNNQSKEEYNDDKRTYALAYCVGILTCSIGFYFASNGYLSALIASVGILLWGYDIPGKIAHRANL